MQPISCVRTHKIKSFAELSRSAKHNYRLIPHHHALNDKAPGWLHGGPDVTSSAKEKLKGKTVRKNAVYAIEVVLTVSHEFFRDESQSPGEYDFSSVEAYESACIEWLDETFGENNILSSVVHTHESVPHIHALILPIDPKGKLNAQHWLDGKAKLSALQDSFAAKLSPLGIVRGQKTAIGSKPRRHVRLRDFYQWVQKLGFDSLRSMISSVKPVIRCFRM